MTAKVKTTAGAEVVLEENFPEETDTEGTGKTKVLDVTAKVKTTAGAEAALERTKTFSRQNRHRGDL